MKSTRRGEVKVSFTRPQAEAVSYAIANLRTTLAAGGDSEYSHEVQQLLHDADKRLTAARFGGERKGGA